MIFLAYNPHLYMHSRLCPSNCVASLSAPGVSVTDDMECTESLVDGILTIAIFECTGLGFRKLIVHSTYLLQSSRDQIQLRVANSFINNVSFCAALHCLRLKS